MAHLNCDDCLPNDMLAFKINQASSNIAARLGTLSSTAGRSFKTPHYVGITSRGVIPHISPDMMHKHTDVKAVYIALEDFIEKAPSQTPPIFSQPHKDEESPLRAFTALTEKQLVVLGPRRIPPIACPLGNSTNTLAICTSVGFSHMDLEDYNNAVATLKPDIAIGLADIPSGGTAGEKRSWKRMEKMCYRTENWMMKTLQTTRAIAEESGTAACNIFAPILPVDMVLQKSYLEMLEAQPAGSFSGLAIYDPDSLPDLPSTLSSYPRLSLHDPSSPHQLLRQIQLGVDLCTITFISAATDAGIALDFTFPAPSSTTSSSQSTPKTLGIDMWNSRHATDVGPLMHACACYACQKHHKAYVQHLLTAKEMLAWILLQVHNLSVLDAFFAGVRASIAGGTFEKDVIAFGEAYEASMPEKTGQGPRIRGYQHSSRGPGPKKQNPTAYRMLDAGIEQNADEGQKADAPVPEPDADAMDLEKRGFGEALGS